MNRLESFPLLSALMGGCFVYLGFGSAFFHASLTYIGQRVDMNATYSIMLTLVGIALFHIGHRLTLTPVHFLFVLGAIFNGSYWVVFQDCAVGIQFPLGARFDSRAKRIDAH